MAKTDFRIREMTEDDIPNVQSMHYGVIPEPCVWDIHSYLTALDGLGFVAENEKLAGYVLSARCGYQARIDYLLVLPQYRRNGIATNLANAAVERHKEEGTRKLFVNISAGNEAALTFARKSGLSLTEVEISDSDRRYYGSLEL